MQSGTTGRGPASECPVIPCPGCGVPVAGPGVGEAPEGGGGNGGGEAGAVLWGDSAPGAALCAGRQHDCHLSAAP